MSGLARRVSACERGLGVGWCVWVEEWSGLGGVCAWVDEGPGCWVVCVWVDERSGYWVCVYGWMNFWPRAKSKRV